MNTTRAKESPSIGRLRKRLKKHLSLQEEKVTEEALSQMTLMIKQTIKRKGKTRVDLTERTVLLFDHNRHSAQIGKATLRLRELVKKDYFRPQSEHSTQTSPQGGP